MLFVGMPTEMQTAVATKKIMTEWVEAFMGHAAALQYDKTQRAVAAAATPVKHHGRWRSQIGILPIQVTM